MFVVASPLVVAVLIFFNGRMSMVSKSLVSKRGNIEKGDRISCNFMSFQGIVIINFLFSVHVYRILL